MKTRKRILGFVTALTLATATGALAQTPPPNDDFANRIVLTGSSITFTGTLAGATYEFAESSVPGGYMPADGGSVWWFWTAPTVSRVVIEIPPTPFTTNAELEVYAGSVLNALTLLDQNMFGFPSGRYVSFMAYPTNTYQFRVGGIGTQPFSLRLTVTNPPVFIFQPQDCVVSPFGSAFFSAMATGPRASNAFPNPPNPSPTAYQWFFNGVPIPDQNSPSLIVHSVTTNQAGTYSVTASNVGGVTDGGSAMLTVIDTNPIPQILALQPTNFGRAPLALAGEPGRWYKIESTPAFPFPSWQLGVHLQLTNTSEVISLFRLDPTQFLRVSLDAHTDGCIAHLREMMWGKKIHGIENRLPPTANFGFIQLKPYIHLTPQGDFIICPDGGTYAMSGTLTNPPTCTLSSVGHRPTNLP